MNHPLASRSGIAIIRWHVYAQRAWRDLTKPQRAALLSVCLLYTSRCV